jgi:hypothetical protein
MGNTTRRGSNGNGLAPTNSPSSIEQGYGSRKQDARWHQRDECLKQCVIHGDVSLAAFPLVLFCQMACQCVDRDAPRSGFYGGHPCALNPENRLPHEFSRRYERRLTEIQFKVIYGAGSVCGNQAERR